MSKYKIIRSKIEPAASIYLNHPDIINKANCRLIKQQSFQVIKYNLPSIIDSNFILEYSLVKFIPSSENISFYDDLKKENNIYISIIDRYLTGFSDEICKFTWYYSREPSHIKPNYIYDTTKKFTFRNHNDITAFDFNFDHNNNKIKDLLFIKELYNDIIESESSSYYINLDEKVINKLNKVIENIIPLFSEYMEIIEVNNDDELNKMIKKNNMQYQLQKE